MILIDAARHGREPPAAELRERGLEKLRGAVPRLLHGDTSAEARVRSGLRDVVDAFLGDRQANEDLFYLAHQVGELLSTIAVCCWEPGEETYTLNCPIYALHRPMAHSIATTVTTECSICGAGALQCNHLAGNLYDGELCVNNVTGMSPVGHIAFTAEPDFIYTWHQPHEKQVDELIESGIIGQPGDPATCTHCQECEGRPGSGDLDPVTRFEKMVAKGMAPDTPPESDAQVML